MQGSVRCHRRAAISPREVADVGQPEPMIPSAIRRPGDVSESSRGATPVAPSSALALDGVETRPSVAGCVVQRSGSVRGLRATRIQADGFAWAMWGSLRLGREA